MKKCSVVGCGRTHYANGFCGKHNDRFKKTGSPTSYSYRDPNEIIDNKDGTHSIVLCAKNGEIRGATVLDSFNIPLVVGYKWSLDGTGYASASTLKNKIIYRAYLHRIIFSVEDGFQVDHIDRDKLNNRISNLRQVNRAQNRINTGLRSNNTSGVTGVCYRKDTHKWQSRIKVGDQEYKLGCYTEKEKAIIARLTAEKKFFKEFAPQQHLFDQYGVQQKRQRPTGGF